MLRIGKCLASNVKRAFTRGIAGSAARPGGHMTVASILQSGDFVPTVAHDMSVERAAQLMNERHIDAVAVTKDDRVVGLFTERDYFDKVLNSSHEATRSSMVGEVGTMGPDLVVARPDDSVEDCLAVMTKKNMTALPVVEQDGHAVGTVTLLELTRQYMEMQADREQTMMFSEQAMFPEDLVLPDGGVHDEELDPDVMAQLATDPTDALLEHTDHEAEERAAQLFCEGSVFPEYTACEEMQLAEAHGKTQPPTFRLFEIEREDRFVVAHSEVLSRMEAFSEPSDFPEASPTDEAVLARA